MFEFKMSSESISIEQKTVEVTKNLVAAHKAARFKIFTDLSKTKAALRSKEFFRRYKNPSESIGKINKRSLLCRPKQKPKRYCFDEWALRSVQEIELERKKIQAYLNQVIADDLKRIKKEEAKKAHEAEIKKKKQEQLKKRIELKQSMRKLTNEEYMIRLKKKEKK